MELRLHEEVKPWIQEYKYCPACQLELSVDEFSKNASRYDGLNGFCKVCAEASIAETPSRQPGSFYKQRNRERARERSRLKRFRKNAF